MSNISEIIKAAAEEQKKHDKLKPVINPVFRDLLDVQTEQSYDELKKTIQAEGVRDPIVIWKEQNTVADGHNRLKIAEELGIPCPSMLKSFKDEAEVKQWIIRNQLGRRNLTPARYEYYIGKLYNEAKVETTHEKLASPGNAAEKIAKEFDISEKTVRRYAAKAKGADVIERLQGKFAKDKQLSNKPTFTPEEVVAIGTASNLTVADKTIKHITSYKKAAVQKKVEDKKLAAVVQAKATEYNLVLAAPDFGSAGYTAASEPKPTLHKNAAVYMIVPDEELPKGIELMHRWGLTFEASFIYYSSKTYDGRFSKIAHQFVLLGMKGFMTGPASGKESSSCILVNGDIAPSVFKLIDTYHNPNCKKLDMRRGVKPLAGWDGISPAPTM